MIPDISSNEKPILEPNTIEKVMIKQLTIITTTLLLSLSSLQAQEWGEVGSSTLYSVVSMISVVYNKYVVEKDTMIDGYPSKKIAVTQIEYVGTGDFVQRLEDEYLGNLYYRAEGDSIYWHNNGAFRFLYDFSPELGDEWKISANTDTPCNDEPYPDFDIMTVRAAQTLLIL